MSEFFDDLARALAKPMPRRRLVRLVGGLIAASTVPGLKISGAAAAVARATSSTPGTIDPPEGPWGPRIPCGKTSFGPVICDPTSNCVKCCPVNGQPGSCCPCYYTCTRAGLCGKPFACPPDGRPYCGAAGNCCNTNEACYRGSVCLPICKPGETLCDRDCCPRGAECVQFTAPGQRGGRLTCMPKCPARRTRCGFNCCPPGQKCIDPSRGACAQCNPGSQPCGKKCCPQGSTCCDSKTGLCCRKSETCVGYGGRARCCPKGTKACETDASGNPICCKKGEVCAFVGDSSGTVPLSQLKKRTCCPPDRAVDFAGGGTIVCCPPGYRSLGGRVIVPAGGGGGLCCRNDKLCGNTCCGTSSDPGINQTCCQGRCVSLYFDANNCGSCGARCPAGQRCQGGACVPA